MSIINNFLEKTKVGLYCIPGKFYLDPNRAVPLAVVSHAHSDHANPGSEKIICTGGTAALVTTRHERVIDGRYQVVNYLEAFMIGPVEVTFVPAGHMLGSAQILMVFEGVRYLYTGDFKTQEDTSCETFHFTECDYLITETTFASPEYAHPDPVAELKGVVNLGSNVVIGAYAIGKAQRLTSLITEYFTHLPIFIHPNLRKYHEVYHDYGFHLGEWNVYTRAEFKSLRQSIYIVPPSDFKRYTRNKNVIKVFATGWKRSYYSCDKVLSVSDHADWNGVLELVEKSKAKKVFTVHGDGSYLKKHYEGNTEVQVEIL